MGIMPCILAKYTPYYSVGLWGPGVGGLSVGCVLAQCPVCVCVCVCVCIYMCRRMCSFHKFMAAHFTVFIFLFLCEFIECS